MIPLHILFLTHHFPSPGEPGAPRPWQLVQYLSVRGHDVTVIAADYNYMSGEKDRDGRRGRLWWSEPVDLNGVRCIRTSGIPGYKKSVLRRVLGYSLFSLLAFLSSLPLKKVDVVFTPNNPPTNTIVGYMLSKLKRARFVEEVREPHPEIDVALGYFTSRPIQRVYRQYHDFFSRRSDLIVSLTPGITRILVNRGVPRSKIIEVPNAYDLENDPLLHEYSVEEAKSRLGWVSKFVILYAGSHGLAPDLQTMLDSAERLLDREDILFVLIGEGDKKRRYTQYAEAHGLGNCLFLPSVPRQRMPLYYRAADVCTHLIRAGEFWKCILPNKVFDYLGSGTAIAFSGQGDTADLVKSADAGIVAEPENPEAYAEAILELYRYPERRREMGENGRDYVLKHFSRERLMATLESRLDSLL